MSNPACRLSWSHHLVFLTWIPAENFRASFPLFCLSGYLQSFFCLSVLVSKELIVSPAYYKLNIKVWIWCNFDRASSLTCGNKMPTRCNRWFLLQSLLFAQHVSGTTMPIIRCSRVLYRWLLPVVFGALVFKLSVWCGAEGYVSNKLKTKAPNTTGSNHLYNTLEHLMTGIMVPETCWEINKICNKNHLLHLVGILFPHTNVLPPTLQNTLSNFYKFFKHFKIHII